MKHLILIRHAKSSWKHDGLEDWERPLNSRGRRNAPALAERFLRQEYRPSLMISSHATRTLTTARIFAHAIDYPIEQIQLSERVYEASYETLAEVIGALPDEHSTVALFGHNPGLTEFINHLCGTDLENLPTSGVAVIELEINQWQDLNRNQPRSQMGRLVSLTYPKQQDGGADSEE